MLTLSGVTHIYADGTKALNNVSLEIPKGMFGLLGPNGAGKSTLMRSIATLQTPSAGSIRFGEIDVIKEPAKLRAQLGYLPQDFGVYPRVSAYDLLDHLAAHLLLLCRFDISSICCATSIGSIPAAFAVAIVAAVKADRKVCYTRRPKVRAGVTLRFDFYCSFITRATPRPRGSATATVPEAPTTIAWMSPLNPWFSKL
jgi:ABC-type Fe3+/spermidine/putrescine transport system ATPase subunit